MLLHSKRFEYEKYFSKLGDEVMFLDSTFELYIHLNNRKIDRINELNLAPAFFGIVIECLLSTTIIKLAKLYENYDGKNRSDRNLNKFLNVVEQCIDIFPQENEAMDINCCDYNINTQLINEDRNLINEKKECLDKLFYWRDKFFAHNDKNYFYNPNQLGEDSKLTIGSIKSLIELAKEILNKYSVAYNGISNTFSASNKFDIDVVLDILYDHNQHK